MSSGQLNESYRGRLAPTPTGYLHLGHARTFLAAQKRSLDAKGQLVLRVEDLDQARCKSEFVDSLEADLHWAGLRWTEGPDSGGTCGPYAQSQRRDHYIQALSQLRNGGYIFPCSCSRKDVQLAALAPHDEEGEVIYPGTCRGKTGASIDDDQVLETNWRFKVPYERQVTFKDNNLGSQSFCAGRDFGDFLVWRRDGIPSYELAVVVDDAAMTITEVVRGEDLLLSTARQLLLYEALGLVSPEFYHCPLVCDESGRRLAKRNKALSLRELRLKGIDPNILMTDDFDSVVRTLM